MNFSDLMRVDFGVPTSPGFNQPYSFPAASATNPAAGFSGLSTNQLTAALGGANLLSNIIAQGNQADSAQSMLNANAFMTDFGIGRDSWATALDTRRQKEGAAWPFEFRANSPKYRQDQLRANLPIAGTSRWGAFMI